MTDTLLVVAKRPQAGQTKTRLTPPLSAGQAAALYECFLRDTLDLMRQTPGVERRIAYLPADEEDYFRALAPDFGRLLQAGDDLGQRLDNALTACLKGAGDKAVIMDSDSPSLPAECLAGAFAALDGADVVLGPCEDGGYYLIGLKRPAPRLLREVPMSTPTVLADTLRLAKEAGLTAALLPAWYDIDTAAELARLRAHLPDLSPERAAYTRRFLAEMGEDGFQF